MRLDEIRIEDLEVFANHGVFHEENVLGQKFLVTAVLCTDTREAGKTDELAASVHYGERPNALRRNFCCHSPVCGKYSLR